MDAVVDLEDSDELSHYFFPTEAFCEELKSNQTLLDFKFINDKAQNYC